MALLSAIVLGACRVTEERPVTRDGEGAVVTSVKEDLAAPLGSASPHVAVKIPRVHPPRKVKDAVPVYPEDAKKKGIQGVVVLELTIERTGRVSDARVMKGIASLDQAAVEAAMQWEYEPPLLGSRPVSITMVVPVHFFIR